MVRNTIKQESLREKEKSKNRRKASERSLYLHDEDVAERLHVSRDTVWRWSKKGKLPKPIKLGDNCTRWVRSEIEAWEADQGYAA